MFNRTRLPGISGARFQHAVQVAPAAGARMLRVTSRRQLIRSRLAAGPGGQSAMNIRSCGGSWTGLHSPQQLGEAIAAARASAAEGGRHPLLTEWMTAPSGPGWTSSSRPGPAFLVEGIAARLPGRDATAGG